MAENEADRGLAWTTEWRLRWGLCLCQLHLGKLHPQCLLIFKMGTTTPGSVD